MVLNDVDFICAQLGLPLDLLELSEWHSADHVLEVADGSIDLDINTVFGCVDLACHTLQLDSGVLVLKEAIQNVAVVGIDEPEGAKLVQEELLALPQGSSTHDLVGSTELRSVDALEVVHDVLDVVAMEEVVHTHLRVDRTEILLKQVKYLLRVRVLLEQSLTIV